MNIVLLLLAGCIENDLGRHDELPCVPTPEICDHVDNDCNGAVDDGVRCASTYPIPDRDDTGDTADTEIVPTELCNGLDDDGDTQIDEDFDLDGDGVARCCDAGAVYAVWYPQAATPYTALAGARSNGDGTFQPGATLDFLDGGGADLRYIGYGEFDSVAGPDIFWYRVTDRQTFLTSCAGGEWQTWPKATLDSGVSGWGDFDADGCLDYVTWDYPAGNFGDHGGTGAGSTYLGACDGTFTQATTTWDVLFLRGEWTGGISWQTGDWNGDDHADLFFWVVASGGSSPSDLWMLPGDGDGDFGDPITLPDLATAANSGAMGDIDGDTCVDWVMGSNDDGDTGSVWAVLGDCAGGVKATRRLVDQASVASAAGQSIYGDGQSRLFDFDGDGDLDLVTSVNRTSSGGAAIFHWTNDGAGNFGAAWPIVPMWDITSVSVTVPIVVP